MVVFPIRNKRHIQITRNFKEVMRLAASKKSLDPNQYEHFYFKSNEKASYLASMRFEGDKEDEVKEFPSCDCGCENATEEEKWKKKVEGMSMEWHFMAKINGVPKVSEEKVFLKPYLGNIFLARCVQ